MGTKYRRDLTPEDFRIISRFKHHLHRLAIIRKINLKQYTVSAAYEQNWYLSGMGWKDNGKIERKDCLCYVLCMKDFRAVVRGISLDIDTVSEGLVIETLKRFSMFFFQKDGNWKWQDNAGAAVVLLEHQRLSPEGTIKKRNPETAKAKLTQYSNKITGTMNHMGIDFHVALQQHSEAGITAEKLIELGLQTKEAEMKKVALRAEIDNRIRQRHTK